MQNQKLTKAVEFFKNYAYTYDIQPNSNQSNDFSLKLYKKYEQLIQQAIQYGKNLIDFFDQKFIQTSSENQILQQEIESLKQTLTDQKKQTDKLLDSSRQIIEEIRKELIDKDWQCKLLSQRIEQLELARNQDLNMYSKQQNYDAMVYDKNRADQKHKYEQEIKNLQFKLSDQIANHKNSQQQISRLSQMIEKYEKQLSEIKEKYSNKQRNQTKEKKFLNQINIKDSAEKPESQYEINARFYQQNRSGCKDFNIEEDCEPVPLQNFGSEEDVLNDSYQRSVLRDVLNNSDFKYNRLNMTKQLLRTQQKQNITDNILMINYTNSYKKQNQLYRNHLFLSKDYNQKQDHTIRNVKEFTMNDNPDYSSDPYFTFFTLTAQCIKINSQFFEKIAEIDIVSREWKNVIENRIPMNLWANHIQKSILELACIKI